MIANVIEHDGGCCDVETESETTSDCGICVALESGSENAILNVNVI